MIDIFDLDYTLLDTAELKNDLAAIFELSEEQFREQERQWFKNEQQHYNPLEHLRLLKKKGYIDQGQKKQLEVRLTSLMQSIDRYLFPGTKELLVALKNQGDKLALISLGDGEWQRLKLNSSDILREYFDDLLVEEKDKTEHAFLAALEGVDHEITIINDKPIEGLKMKEFIESLGGHCKLVIVKGPYSQDKNETELVGGLYLTEIAELKQSLLIKKETSFNQEFKLR